MKSQISFILAGSCWKLIFVCYVNSLFLLVVTNVLQHDKHSIDGAALSVSQSYTTSGLTDKEEIQESRTIEVTGLASTTTKDSIVNFFENTRRSGGGEIENVDFMPDKGYAVVTFISAQSKRNVRIVWLC